MLSIKSLSAIAALLSFVALVIILQFGWLTYPPGVTDASGFVHRYTSEDMKGCAWYRMLEFFGGDPYVWGSCEREFTRTGTLSQFNFRYYGAAITLGVLILSLCVLGLTRHSDRKTPKVENGREYFRGRKAYRKLKAACAKAAKRCGSALQFPPGIWFPWNQENRHKMIWGSVGSGKTQTMLNIMIPVINRGDKVLVLDTKGDMTAGLPWDINLLAPQDKRSIRWDIAKDCRTSQDARELSARLIPEGKDRIWSDAARSVLTACLISLQADKGENWTWEHLRERAVGNLEELRELAKRHYPQALQILSEDGGKTTQSILTTLQSHLQIVYVLAEAWGRGDTDAFSIADWAKSETHQKPLIVQYDGKYPSLSNAWIASLISTLAGTLCSPAFPEDPNRRIWLFLDEFPQLDRVEHFSTLIDTGRSKGVCVVIGMQDFAQLRDRYGKDTADAWLNMIGTHIITRMNFGHSAEIASRMIGQQQLLGWRRTENRSAHGKSYTWTPDRFERRAVTVSDLSHNLGPLKNKVRVLMLGTGKDVYEIDLPIYDLKPVRPASVPADWVKGIAANDSLPDESSKPRLSLADIERIRGRKSG